MIITKELIESELSKTHSLKSKTFLTQFKSPEELYQIYNPHYSNKCKICLKNTKFFNFKKGYDNVCSRECRKQLIKQEFKPDINNTIDKNKLIEFLLKEFSSTNVANKLHISYFIKNDYIKELNTLFLYNININDLKIKELYDFIYSPGFCENCGKETNFISFKDGYRKFCQNKCYKTSHMTEPVKNYVLSTFIENNQFLIHDMMKHYNVSASYVNKYKQTNNIDIENKHSKYTYGEQVLFNEFKDSDIVFKTNSRNIIHPYEIDFVIDNLCIEYDGLMFHSDGLGFPGNNGKRFKDKLIPEQYQLLTIFETEFLDEQKKKIWLSVINNKLNNNISKIYARKCEIKEIDNKTTTIFLENNHLQGYAKSSINLGLFYNKELVSLLTFSKSRFNKNAEYELIRFCSQLNTTVVGGASKLLKYFERTYFPKSIISYANKRWSNGNLYEKLKFDYVEDTAPNYFYFKPNNNILYSRNKFQKHKLPKLLNIFDQNLTEKENMFNNGYRKIFDYGNKKYIKYYE